MPKLRSDQNDIYVAVYNPAGKNILDSGVWATMEGGDMSSTDTKSRPGGMGDEESYGGPRTRSNATVSRQYSTDILHPLIPLLETLCGAAAGKMSWRPLDPYTNPDGNTHSISGRLVDVQTTKRDANSPEAMFLTLVFSCSAAPVVIS